MVAAPDVVDVGPVCHYHAVPVKSFFEPFGQQAAVGMEGHAVVVGGVDHQAQRTSLAAHAERLEVLLHHLAIGHAGWCAVLAADGSTISQIVLQTSCHVLHPHMVGVIALKTTCQLGSHDAVQQHVLAEALPHAGPERRTCHIHDGRIHPGNEAGTALVSRYLTDAAGDGSIEAGALSHFLREERRAPGVAGTVNLVDTIYLRHTALLHGSLVEGADDVCPLLWRLRHTERHVQDGAYAVLPEHVIGGFCRQHTAGQRARGVVVLHVAIARTLRHLVDSQFAHLPHLVAECHLGEQCFDLCFDLFVTGDALRTRGQCDGSPYDGCE